MTADFPLCWRLVLLDGSERVIEIRRTDDGPVPGHGVGWRALIAGEPPGMWSASPRRALRIALINAGLVATELHPLTEPLRRELVAALRAHVSATDDHDDEDRQRAESAALRATRALLARVPQ